MIIPSPLLPKVYLVFFFGGCNGLFGVFRGVKGFIWCFSRDERVYLVFFEGCKGLFGVFQGV